MTARASIGRALAAGLAAGLPLVGSPAVAAAPQEVASGNRADYVIRARLEGDTHAPKTLQGGLELTWTNGSGEAVSDLWFHLYLNAFSNNRSTHLAESGGTLRGVDVEDGWGWSRVTGVRVDDPGDGGFRDVFHTFEYVRPDDGREDDRTVFRVVLPRAIADGESVRVELDWESRLPRVRRRTGYKDDFLLVAQWFPKLGVYEAGRGWNCHQFHMNSEFYSDYGTYDVTLDLPSRFEGFVAGSGVPVLGELRGGDRYVARFVAPATKDQMTRDATGRYPLVHDFTWTADPRYVVKNYRWEFAKWAEDFPGEVARAERALGPDFDVRKVRNVDVYVLIHPEREDQAYRHFEATAAALFFYGLWFGEYPYERVTVVDPAWGARAAGGMEYPTLFTAGTRLFTTEDMYTPESVTVHEAGHQFWYGLVGNNEFEAAWLDEGFNSYTDSEVLWRVYGERRETTVYAGIPVDGVRVTDLPGGGRWLELALAQRIPLPWILPDLKPVTSSGFLDWWRDQPALTFVPETVDPRWADRTGYLRDPASDPVATAAWEFADRTSYRANSYPRTAVVLRSLPAVIGYDSFLRGMRTYSEEWRYRHPYPEDFYRTFQDGAGVDVDWYFRELFEGTGTVDWSVTVEQERRPKVQGFVQGEGGEFFEVPSEEAADGSDEEPWRATIVVRREGTLRLPLPVRMSFEDGSTEEWTWSREEQEQRTWKRLQLERNQKLVSVELDPARGYYLDGDMSNNRWYDETEDLTGWRWGERVLGQFQRYLHWIMGIGG